MAHTFPEAARESLTRESVSHEQYLPCLPGSPFVFAHNPRSFEYSPGPPDEDGLPTPGEWLPRVKRLKLDPGANMCKVGSWGAYRTKLEGEGYTFIPDDVEVCFFEDGELQYDDGYLFSVRCRKKKRTGKVYIDPWDHPSILGLGESATIDWRTERDKKGFDEWRRKLLRDGVLKPPTRGVITKILAIQSRRASRKAGKANNDYLAKLVEREVLKLAQMTEAAEAFKGSGFKRKRSKRKKRGRQREAVPDAS